jgi:hypothetical protein
MPVYYALTVLAWQLAGWLVDFIIAKLKRK